MKWFTLDPTASARLEGILNEVTTLRQSWIWELAARDNRREEWTMDLKTDGWDQNVEWTHAYCLHLSCLYALTVVLMTRSYTHTAELLPQDHRTVIATSGRIYGWVAIAYDPLDENLNFALFPLCIDDHLRVVDLHKLFASEPLIIVALPYNPGP